MIGALLDSDAVQQAVIALAVVALTAAAKWVKSKISHADIVDEWWCYVQPAADWAAAELAARTRARRDAGRDARAVAADVLAEALGRFAEAYRRHEGRAPSETVMAAAAGEIEEILER